MKAIVYGFTTLAVASGMLTPANAAPPDSFAACAACHTADGTNGLGPTIKGIYGRRAGTVGGFTYSRAMRTAGVTWDDSTLEAFLADPQKAIPGNVMPFPGIADARQRADIIAYLKTVK